MEPLAYLQEIGAGFLVGKWWVGGLVGNPPWYVPVMIATLTGLNALAACRHHDSTSPATDYALQA
jgi:hypothetical protein